MGTRVPETTTSTSTSSTRQETNSLFSKTRTTISTSKKVATIPSRPGRSCSGKKEPRSTDSGLRNKETGKTYPCRKRKICTAVTSTVPSWNSTRERTCGRESSESPSPSPPKSTTCSATTSSDGIQRKPVSGTGGNPDGNRCERTRRLSTSCGNTTPWETSAITNTGITSTTNGNDLACPDSTLPIKTYCIIQSAHYKYVIAVKKLFNRKNCTSI